MIRIQKVRTPDHIGRTNQIFVRLSRVEIGLGWVESYHSKTKRLYWKNCKNGRARAIEIHMFRVHVGICIKTKRKEGV